MIKEQCNKCKLSGSCHERVVYDSNSCPNYIKSIDFEKHAAHETELYENGIGISGNDVSSSGQVASSEEKGVVTKEDLKESTDIHGWLSFFLFSILVGGAISFIYPIATFNIDEYSGIWTLALSDVIFGVMIFATAIVTVYAFITRRPDAVFLGKTYVVVCLLSNLLVLFEGNYTDSGLGSVTDLVRGVIWALIWFLYLSLSNQVKEVIPVEYRKHSKVEVYLIAAMIFVPALLLAIGVNQANDRYKVNIAESSDRVELKKGEKTDGRVIFSVPEGFECTSQNVENLQIFTLDDQSVGSSATICSDFDTNDSKENFAEYIQGWEDSDIASYDKIIVLNETRSINRFKCNYRVISYDIDGTIVYWRFAMLFDTASAKTCIISAYDIGVDTYFEDILNSIRFE